MVRVLGPFGVGPTPVADLFANGEDSSVRRGPILSCSVTLEKKRIGTLLGKTFLVGQPPKKRKKGAPEQLRIRDTREHTVDG